MRKIVLIVILSILIILFGFIIFSGIHIGNFEVLSYMGIDGKSKELDKKISEFEDKNSKEMEEKQQKIKEQIKKYQEKKESYENLLEVQRTNFEAIDAASCYEVDFLWTRVGNYATERGLEMEFKISKNSTDSNNENYMLTDLNFTISGTYDGIANFINDLESDEKLEFEIRNFTMKTEEKKDEKTGKTKETKLIASFVVNAIALNKNTITTLTTETSTSTNNNNNNATNSTNTTNVSNSTNTANSVNSVNTRNSTNSRNTTTNSNNVVNQTKASNSVQNTTDRKIENN